MVVERIGIMQYFLFFLLLTPIRNQDCLWVCLHIRRKKNKHSQAWLVEMVGHGNWVKERTKIIHFCRVTKYRIGIQSKEIKVLYSKSKIWKECVMETTVVHYQVKVICQSFTSKSYKWNLECKLWVQIASCQV